MPSSKNDGDVGSRVRMLRSARGLTQAELAELAGKTRQTISKLETGQTTPDIETLRAVAGALDTDVSALAQGPASAVAAADRLQRAARDITGEEPDADLMELVAMIKRKPDREAAELVDAVLLTARIVRRDDSAS